jgi:pimeloyl-ACP methyl ester carboxylesterase
MKLIPICLDALALTVLAATNAIAAPPASSEQDQFALPHQLVDIGGRRLNLYCAGTGSPTVVFDSPSGDAGWVWAAVQPQVAKKTRACVYDRAGLGFSDPSPRPGTSENAVDDLHKLLVRAGVQPPYVLVGNSYGGLNVQLYTYRYRDEVSALVLAEAGNENETRRFDLATHGKVSQMNAMMRELGKQCEQAAVAGFVPGSAMLAQCTQMAPAGVGRALAAAQFAAGIKPAHWKALNSENNNYQTSEDQLRAMRKPFGDLPLVVLTRSVSPYAIPGQPQSALNKALEDENLALQEEMARFSSRGSNRVVKGAGHLIEVDQPQAVVAAIDEVLAKLK